MGGRAPLSRAPAGVPRPAPAAAKPSYARDPRELASKRSDGEASLHQLFQLLQDKQVSPGEFLEALSEDGPHSVPPACVRLIEEEFGSVGVGGGESQSRGAAFGGKRDMSANNAAGGAGGLTFDRFLRAWRESTDEYGSNSFAETGKLAGSKTKYGDSAGSLLSYGSRPDLDKVFDKARTGHDNAPTASMHSTFRRARTDITNLTEERKAVTRRNDKDQKYRPDAVRRSNDMSARNPMNNAGGGPGACFGLSENETMFGTVKKPASEKESNLSTALRMYMAGELKRGETAQFIAEHVMGEKKAAASSLNASLSTEHPGSGSASLGSSKRSVSFDRSVKFNDSPEKQTTNAIAIESGSASAGGGALSQRKKQDAEGETDIFGNPIVHRGRGRQPAAAAAPAPKPAAPKPPQSQLYNAPKPNEMAGRRPGGPPSHADFEAAEQMALQMSQEMDAAEATRRAAQQAEQAKRDDAFAFAQQHAPGQASADRLMTTLTSKAYCDERTTDEMRFMMREGINAASALGKPVGSVEDSVNTILHKHEVNGPFNYQKLIGMLREACEL